MLVFGDTSNVSSSVKVNPKPPRPPMPEPISKKPKNGAFAVAESIRNYGNVQLKIYDQGSLTKESDKEKSQSKLKELFQNCDYFKDLPPALRMKLKIHVSSSPVNTFFFMFDHEEAEEFAKDFFEGSD